MFTLNTSKEDSNFEKRALKEKKKRTKEGEKTEGDRGKVSEGKINTHIHITPHIVLTGLS